MKPLLASAIFLLSALLVVGCVIRKPYIILKAGKGRRFKLETYFLGALLGPVLMYSTGLLSPGVSLISLLNAGAASPLKILALFFSMVFISAYLDKTGFFAYCAAIAFTAAGGSAKKLFFILYGAVSVLTVFTSNDIVILTFTPFIYHFAVLGKRNPLPYLIAEFFAANSWSMMLYIGNPTNIFLASAFSIDFFEYARWMFLPAVTAGLSNLILLYLLFRTELSKPLELPSPSHPKPTLRDRTGMFIGIGHLAATVIFLSLAPYFKIEMWLVTVLIASSLAIILFFRTHNPKVTSEPLLSRTLSSLPYTVIPFVLSMFLMVDVLSKVGISTLVAALLHSIKDGNVFYGTLLYGTTSAALSNIINNIPMTVAFSSILSAHTASLSDILAVALGSNLGANFTPIGALAGIIWMSILKEKSVELSFLRFARYGLIVSSLTLLISLMVLGGQFLLFK